MSDRSITIVEKIDWANRINSEFGDLLLEDEEVNRLLKSLQNSIKSTNSFMRKLDTLRFCSECGNVHGSCCNFRIDDLFDAKILLINLLLGVGLPDEREIEGGCFFQGRDGCKLMAREIICVDTFCDELIETMGLESFIEFKNISGEEHLNVFLLENRINSILSSYGTGFGTLTYNE